MYLGPFPDPDLGPDLDGAVETGHPRKLEVVHRNLELLEHQAAHESRDVPRNRYVQSREEGLDNLEQVLGIPALAIQDLLGVRGRWQGQTGGGGGRR